MMSPTLMTTDQVDTLLNDCGAGDGIRKHRKLASVTRDANKKYLRGLIREQEDAGCGNGYTEAEMELMLHSFNEGYPAAPNKSQ